MPLVFCQDNVYDNEERTFLWEMAERYVNEREFAFSSEDLATYRDQLLARQVDPRAELKKQQLKAFIPKAISYMDEDELLYWQAIIAEAYVLSLFQYNFYKLLNRKQLFAESEANLLWYRQHLIRLTKALPREDCEFDESDYQLLPSVYDPGFTVADWLRDQFGMLMQTPSVAMREWLSEMNWHRLYWVWAGGNGGLLSGILDLESVKSGIDKAGHAARNLDLPMEMLGYLSWALYFARLLINIGLFLKHTINPWMSEDEKAIPLEKRALMQWDQRKFIMLNDLVWGVINLVTIYWLTSNVSKQAGAWGGVLTIFLMLIDVAIAYWELSEKTTQYNNACSEIDKKIDSTRKKQDELLAANAIQSMLQVLKVKQYLLLFAKDEASAKKSATEEVIKLAEKLDINTCNRLLSMEKQLVSLREEKTLLDFDWKYEKKKLKANLICSSLFVPDLAMILVTCFPYFLHGMIISTAILSAFVVGGGVFAMLLTAGQTYYCKQQDINKLREKLQAVDEKLAVISTQKGGLDFNRQKKYELEETRLILEREYLTKKIRYERYNQIFSCSVQMLFPVLVLGSLFLSGPMTVLVIAAFIVLALTIKLSLMHMAPKEVNNELIGAAEQLSALDDSENETIEVVECNVNDTKPSSTVDGALKFGLFAHPLSFKSCAQTDTDLMPDVPAFVECVS